MKKIILSIIQKRNRLNWTARELAKKADVPLKALLSMEKDERYYPEYVLQLKHVLDNALEGVKKTDNSCIDRRKYNYKIQKYSLNTGDNPKSHSRYFIDTSDIDLKIYFPHLSPGQERMLFGYSKYDNKEKKIPIERKIDIEKEKLSEHNKEVKKEAQKITYPKINFRIVEGEDRLAAVLEYVKGISFPDAKVRQFKKNFSPNFNPLACKWFEEFDKINNTVGFYATTKGEYYIEELGYFPDYFNAELKLIMEWDENYHFTKDGQLSAKDRNRQKAIQECFPDFNFIRIKEEDVKEYLD